METKYRMICIRCGKTYNSATGVQNECPNCGGPVRYTGFTAEVWEQLSEEEKNKANRKIENDNVSLRRANSRSENSGYSRILKWFNKLGIIVGVIVSAVLGMLIASAVNEGIGLAVFVTGFIISILAHALTMVFLEIADDLRVIRNFIQNR